MKTINVNEELRKLIPPLTKEEYEGLIKSIITEGCRDSIIIWNDTIVDGHNRYQICTDNNIEFKTTEKNFNDINEVKEWIIINQFSRRNINDWQRSVLALKLKGLYKEKAKENQKLSEGRSVKGSAISPNLKIDTRKEISKIAGVGESTITQVEKIEEKGSDELKQQLTTGKISINQAFNEIKKDERKAQIEEQKRLIESGEIKLPEGVYQHIVMDPPWNYNTEYRPDSGFGRVACPYPLMSFEELSQIEIPADKDSVLWLWTTHQFIWEAKELMKLWGFEYKAILVWNKEKMGIGSWLRMQCEFCLVGIKGKPMWTAHNLRDIITEPRREHSRKPDQFYTMIEENFSGRFLDYFSRTTFSDKWDVYGNDTNKF
mgnify:CR=1 FL=1